MCPRYEEGVEDGLDPIDHPVDIEGPVAPDLVVVIDSSTIIQLKLELPAADQWKVFAKMLELVQGGRLTFPRQVARELANEKHPDGPGIWCGEAAKHVQHPNPSDATMADLLEWIAELVEVDAEADREPADPYIVAMAWELLEAGYDVAVVTEDQVDRLPVKIALTTACNRLGIIWWDLETFLNWLLGHGWNSKP